MDRREAIAASYYAQRGGGGVSGAQPVLHGSRGMTYQGNYGVGTMIGPPLPAEASSVVSPHSVNVGTPTVVPVGQVEPVKRRRGRPRKYGSDGSVSLALSSASISPPASSSIGSMQRRGRGRPPRSGRKLQTVSPAGQLCLTVFARTVLLGSLQTAMAGVGFTPDIITIAVGEDVAMKIMSFAQQCSRAVCILSATGSVSTVTLRQFSSSGSTVTYEGPFEILCLSGSLVLMDNTGSRNRIGGLSISLASPDGHVIGGVVGGLLIAATPVQVVIGSFSLGNSKSKNKKREGPMATDSSDLVIQPLNPTSVPPGQKLSAVPVGMWPDDSQPIDIDDVHDIDLMRG